MDDISRVAYMTFGAGAVDVKKMHGFLDVRRECLYKRI